jgi:hypothetical protein
LITMIRMNIMILIQISLNKSGRDINLFLMLYQVLMIVEICVVRIVVQLKENEKIAVNVYIRAENA